MIDDAAQGYDPECDKPAWQGQSRLETRRGGACGGVIDQTNEVRREPAPIKGRRVAKSGAEGNAQSAVLCLY